MSEDLMFLSNNEITKIYQNSNLNHKIVDCCFMEKENCKYVEITISSKNLIEDDNYLDNEVTESPAVRTYYENKQLINSPICDKVVNHESFTLKGDFRKKGLAKKIHNEELEIYRNNSVKEIHLKSASDGILVWLFLEFDFIDEDEKDTFFDDINLYINLYFKNILGIKSYKINNVSDLTLIKKKLLPKDKISFTEWLKSNCDCLTYSMYKRL
jgi:hypothetical protein